MANLCFVSFSLLIFLICNHIYMVYTIPPTPPLSGRLLSIFVFSIYPTMKRLTDWITYSQPMSQRNKNLRDICYISKQNYENWTTFLVCWNHLWSFKQEMIHDFSRRSMIYLQKITQLGWVDGKSEWHDDRCWDVTVWPTAKCFRKLLFVQWWQLRPGRQHLTQGDPLFMQ